MDSGNTKTGKHLFFMKKYLPAITAAASAALLIAGIVLGNHTTVLSYAIIVCLSCIGIG